MLRAKTTQFLFQYTRITCFSLMRIAWAKGAVRRTCRVSKDQLSLWQSQVPRKSATSADHVQVLTVVDDPEQQPQLSLPEQGLELRLGPFRVTVRLDAACDRAGA